MTGRKLFVGGLGRTTTTDSVRARLAEFGQVVDVSLVTDADTGLSLGFGFVTFATAAEARHALFEADGVGVDGHGILLAAPGSRRATRGR